MIGRSRHRWEDTLKRVVEDLACQFVDWNRLAEETDHSRTDWEFQKRRRLATVNVLTVILLSGFDT